MSNKFFQRCDEVGAPTLKHPQWLYTNFDKINLENKAQLPRFWVDKKEYFKVNTLEVENNNTTILPKNPPRGIIFNLLSNLSKDEKIRTLFESLDENFEQYLIAYGENKSVDKIILYIPDNFYTETPFLIRHNNFVTEKLKGEHYINNIETYVYIGKNANIMLAEEFCLNSTVGKTLTTNSVTKIFLDENANLDYLCSNYEEHSNCTFLHNIISKQNTSSSLNEFIFNQSKSLSKIYSHKTTIGNDTLSNSYNIQITKNSEHKDTYFKNEHSGLNCQSHIISRSVAANKSTNASTGHILVKEGATDTDANFDSKGILLNDNAKIHSSPQLEIYHDSVKCSHGATIGHLDENEIFYLKSRGLTEHEAKVMLVDAFIGQIVNKIPYRLQKSINLKYQVEKSLKELFA